MWQKCPSCNGTGRANTYIPNIIENCGVCNARGILNTITGLPPKNVNTSVVNKNSGDFRDNVESQQEYYGKK